MSNPTVELLKEVILEANLPEGQNWATLEDLLKAAERLDNGDTE